MPPKEMKKNALLKKLFAKEKKGKKTTKKPIAAHKCGRHTRHGSCYYYCSPYAQCPECTHLRRQDEINAQATIDSKSRG